MNMNDNILSTFTNRKPAVDRDNFSKHFKEFEIFAREIDLDIDGRGLYAPACFNYEKWKSNGQTENYTGCKLEVSRNNLAIIDFDINKDFLINPHSNEFSIQESLECLENRLKNIAKKFNCILVQTASNSYHLYCNGDSIRNEYEYLNKMNTYTKIYSHYAFNDEDVKVLLFDIDLFLPTKMKYKEKEVIRFSNECDEPELLDEFDYNANGVMLPGSMVMNKNGEIGDYRVIVHKVDKSKKMSDVSLVWNELGHRYKLPEIASILKDIPQIRESTPYIAKKVGQSHIDHKMTKKLFYKIMECFNGLVIHNYASPIEERITLLPIASSLNCAINTEINEDDVAKFKEYIWQNCDLTEKAKSNFDKIMNVEPNDQSTPFTLSKIIKIYKPDEYDKFIKPLMKPSLFDQLIYKLENIYGNKLIDSDIEIIIRVLYGFYGKELDNDKFFEILDNIECLCDCESLSKSFDDMIDESIAKGSLNLKSLDNLSYINAQQSCASIDLKDPFIFNNIPFIDYFPNGILDKEKLYNDIKRVYVGISGSNTYFIKTRSNGKIKLERLSYHEMKCRADQITLYEDKSGDIKLSNYILKGRDKILFEKPETAFISNDPNVFSIFRGFIYENDDNIDMESIKLFLDHMKEVICNEDEILYQYLISWIAFIIQNPGKRTGVCLVLLSDPGSGKTLFTNTISELMRPYCNPNIPDIAIVAGNFNNGMENNILVVLNETNVNNSKNVDKYQICDKMKTMITDEEITINAKYRDPYTIDNVSNFIIVSNSDNPIIIEEKDRRYVVFEVSGKYIKNTAYFEKIYKSMNAEFYKNLFNYFRTLDINEFKVSEIPTTSQKNQIINKTKDTFDKYIDHNIDKYYPKGRFTSRKQAYLDYMNFCESENIKNFMNGMDFEDKLNKKCVLKSQRIEKIDSPRKVYVLIKD